MQNVATQTKDGELKVICPGVDRSPEKWQILAPCHSIRGFKTAPRWNTELACLKTYFVTNHRCYDREQGRCSGPSHGTAGSRCCNGKHVSRRRGKDHVCKGHQLLLPQLVKTLDGISTDKFSKLTKLMLLFLISNAL